MKKLIIYLVSLMSVLMAGTAAHAAIIVGRISHVEGEIYRYMDVDDSWVETYLQSPAGIEDVLATGKSSRAEIAFPNNLLLQLDGNTEVEILELDNDFAVFQLNSGLARLYNRNAAGTFVIETVRGTAKVAPGSVIDVLVEGNTVVVSAVQGEATFQSLRNGVEGLEVISGSTSLEFRAEAIVAGTGPLSLNWDRWCANREGVWGQNRLVRSKYLPESMQEYAYEMEPYGNWNRVYYSGYNYWAWKPRYVAAGWSPYTNGYWYDWHGSPVWIDNNPWGWVTHHHGHWIQMQGAWMWTPYVNVSHTPGVTVIGLNITFGKTYRSNWHPGRVRWITHNDNIGWFPLAPQETYYGYRRWGAGTVLVRGGSSFRPGINLSQHRHIADAVIIPKQHLYKKGRIVVNNYNTVKIRNIDKTVIVKDYKPMLTTERKRARQATSAKSAPARNSYRRSVLVQSDRKRITAAGSSVQHATPVKRDARIIQTQRNLQKTQAGQIMRQRARGPIITKEQGQSVATARQREKTGARERQKKAVMPEQRSREMNAEKQEKSWPRIAGTANISVPRTQLTKGDEVRAKARVFRQAEAKNSRSKGVQEKTTAIREKASKAREQVQKEAPPPQRQDRRNAKRVEKANVKTGSKYTEKEERQENKSARQISRNENSTREKNITRNADSQKPGREWVSASLNNRRLR